MYKIILSLESIINLDVSSYLIEAVAVNKVQNPTNNAPLNIA